MAKPAAPAFGRRTMNDNRPASRITGVVAPVLASRPYLTSAREDRRDWTGRDESEGAALVAAFRRSF